jgi:hypothetical protein
VDKAPRACRLKKAARCEAVNSNSEENKDHVELTEKSAQQWLKIRRYTPVPEGDVSEQGLKEVGGDGTPSTGVDGNVPPR